MDFFLEQFGGKGDGIFNNVNAFAMAFSEICRCGGGTLRIKKGRYLTGPLEIPSDTTVFLEEGAEIIFTDKISFYFSKKMPERLCMCKICSIFADAKKTSYGREKFLFRYTIMDAGGHATSARRCGCICLYPWSDAVGRVRKERMAWIHPQVGKSVTHQPFHDE